MPQRASSEQRLAAVEALINGESMTAAANKAGVHRDTVGRWVNHDPEFKALMAEAHSGAVHAMQHRLAGLTEIAVDTLAHVCEFAERDADRLTAAKAILDRVAPTDQPPDDQQDFDLRDILGDQYETIFDAVERARDDNA